MNDEYSPKEGDIVWLSFNPVKGKEQGKRRPALVVSPIDFNRTGLCIVCPISSKVKGLRMEVEVDLDKDIKGVILPNHVKSLDWKKRNIELITRCNEQVKIQVKLRLALILGVDQSILDLLAG